MINDRMGGMELIDRLKAEAPFIKWQGGIKLADISYMKVGGEIKVFGQAKTTKKLIGAVKYCHENGLRYRVVGSLSNMVGSDEGYEGILIQDLTQELRDNWASSGWRMSGLVAEFNKRGLGGWEEMMSLPGTLGGAIYNNAHFGEKMISDYIEQVDYYDPIRDEQQKISAVRAEFAYEYSIFQGKQWIILGASFNLETVEPQVAREKALVAAKWRLERQPLECPSSGCVFQNVPNNPRLKKLFPQFTGQEFVSVGFLIDQAGLKGQKSGGMEISQKHAAFIINPERKGTRADFDKLVKLIKTTLQDKYGVELQEEIFYLE